MLFMLKVVHAIDRDRENIVKWWDPKRAKMF